MSRALEIAILGLGGLCLFAVSFLGFALSAGVPMKDVAVIGSLFAEGQQAPAPDETAYRAPTEVVRSDVEVVNDHLALLSVWSLDSPFEAEELGELAAQIKAKADDLDRRLETVSDQEAHFAEKAETLTAQHATLDEIRAELEAYDAKLRLREAELKRDENASAAQADAEWTETARLFEDGEVGQLASRLQQFAPQEAARILRALDQARARELLDALPADQWKTYAAAYTRAGS